MREIFSIDSRCQTWQFFSLYNVAFVRAREAGEVKLEHARLKQRSLNIEILRRKLWISWSGKSYVEERVYPRGR